MSKIPKRIAATVVNSLQGGVVPRVGLEYVTVGRKSEIEALLRDISIIEDGGASFRFVMGKYGSGKSFLLQTIRNYAMKKGFVVVDADLSPDRRLSGTNGQGLATYKELIKNMSTSTKSDGGALSLILEKWISNIKVEVMTANKETLNEIQFNKLISNKIMSVVNEMQGMIHGFEFGTVIKLYWQSYIDEDEDMKSNVLKWFRGEYLTKRDSKNAIGVSEIISDNNWYEYIKIFALFLVRAGYKGMIVLIDELVNIYKITNTTSRQNNYEKMLAIYNDMLQGKANYIGVIMGGTPQSIEDKHRGVFSYEALQSRLETSKFSKEGMQDLMSPIIKLEPLTNSEMYVLIEKLAQIHSDLYSYSKIITDDELIKFLTIEYSRVGADKNITPREIIRDFISLLNISIQNGNKSLSEIMNDGKFEFSENKITDDEIHQEFADFNV